MDPLKERKSCSRLKPVADERPKFAVWFSRAITFSARDNVEMRNLKSFVQNKIQPLSNRELVLEEKT